MHAICGFRKEFLKNSDNILSFEQFKIFGQPKQIATEFLFDLYMKEFFRPNLSEACVK